MTRLGVGTEALAIFALLALTSCADKADRDGNGVDDSEEVASEMNFEAFVPMKAGSWETKFTFTDLNVPTLGKSQKRQIMDEIAKNASQTKCLSEAEAKQPPANFFGGDSGEKCIYKMFDVDGRNVAMKVSCGMDGMGSVDMDLAGQMGETAFDYDSKVDIRLPMIGKVTMTGNAVGRYIGPCTSK